LTFFLKRGAPRNCPEQLDYDYLYPHSTLTEDDRGINPEFYCTPAIHVFLEGVVCNGQKSMGGNLRSMCRECKIRGRVFPEMNSNNYLEILGPIDPTPRTEEIYKFKRS